jgi:uncharacterized alpha-E superfamily protein
MLSRVAENIYWMARHVERAENTARLITVNTHLLLDLPKKVQLGWEPIVDILSARDLFSSLYSDTEERSVLKFLITDMQHYGSILSSLCHARENARTIRDIIPREAWERVNDLYLVAKADAQSGLARRARFFYLRTVILGAQTITGLLAGTMTHDEGYDFLRMGRNLERADMTTRIIDVRSASLLAEQREGLTYENIQWMSVLKSLTAYQMYRRAIQVRVRRPDVLKFLLQNPSFPRALYHSLCEMEACLKNLPHHDKPLAAVKGLEGQLLEADPAHLKQAELHAFIDDLQIHLAAIHDTIAATYFLIKR